MNTLTKYLLELETELHSIMDKLKSSTHKEGLEKKKDELEDKIKKVNSMIDKRKSTFLVKTNKGYLSANGNFTDNINLAYNFKEEEAVSKARAMGGWLEELPDSDFIK